MGDPVYGSGKMRKNKNNPEYRESPQLNDEEVISAPQKQTSSKKKMPLALRIVLIVVSILVILSLSVLLFTIHYLNKINRDTYQGDITISHTELLEESEIHDVEDSTDIIEQVWMQYDELKEQPVIESDEHTTNYLLIGCDDRGDSNTGNSDSMMIVTVNRSTKKIHITSLMRGCFVIYPEGFKYEDGMLNWAYAWGGPEKLIETVEMNFKVDIDHFVAVSFEPFVEIVDAIGGIEVEMTPNEAWYVDTNVPGSYLNYYVGTYHLNGYQALAFSRCRGAERFDNDFMRTSRQRDVIEAIIRQVGTLSVPQLTELADILLPAISTDMTNTDILSEVVNIAEYAEYEMDQLLIPFENQEYTNYVGKMYKYGAEMYAIDWSTNLPVLEEFISG